MHESLIRELVPLAPFTTLGLGGPARYFIECSDESQLRAALTYAAERRMPVYILGGGSNVIFSDVGFPGLVIRITIGGIEFRDGSSPELTAGAGVDWDTVVRGTVERGWTGIECLSGIPGTAGGTPIQNVGAYGQEIAETLGEVACLDRRTLERRSFTAAECGFAYRDSRFKRGDRGRWVVLAVTLRVARDREPELRYPELRDAVARAAPTAGSPAERVRLVRDTVLSLRRGKSMVLDPTDPNTRSAGSFFMNPVLAPAAFAELERSWQEAGGRSPIPTFAAAGGVKVPAAWLVEQAGFPKGYRDGGVGVSSRHALALVNFGGTSAQLLALAERIVQAVEQRFGVRLELEPEVVRQ